MEAPIIPGGWELSAQTAIGKSTTGKTGKNRTSVFNNF
jgi:hypothetical protein